MTMEFRSVDSFRMERLGWTLYTVKCPIEGPRDEVIAALKGPHKIDGVLRQVVGVEAPCVFKIRRDHEVSLAVED